MIKISSKDLTEEKLQYAALSGTIAGVVMGLFEMLAALGDKGFWAPVRGFAAVFKVGVKDPATQYDFLLGPVMVGFVLYVIISMILGVVFYIILGGAVKKISTKTGFFVASLWGFMVYVILFIVIFTSPALNYGHILIEANSQFAWIFGYLVFGVVQYSSLRYLDNIKVES